LSKAHFHELVRADLNHNKVIVSDVSLALFGRHGSEAKLIIAAFIMRAVP